MALEDIEYDFIVPLNTDSEATAVEQYDSGELVVSAASDSVPIGGTVTVTTFFSDPSLPFLPPQEFTTDYTFVGQNADGLLVQLPGDPPILITRDNSITAGDVIDLADFDTVNNYECFTAGTLFETPRGIVAVEDLVHGDKVRTVAGGWTEVKWVGRKTRSKYFSEDAIICPVEISAGALADNVPAQDLHVSSDHGIIFEDAIVHAGAMVNGTTIRRVAKAELPEMVTYYHVETEGHDAVLANGCPAETFIDNVTRKGFDNYAEYVELYGNRPEPMVAMDLPRALGPRQLPVAIREQITERVPHVMGEMAKAG
ncbi:MAG: Hint domain-containing protein [Pseudomonadota bacterium]